MSDDQKKQSHPPAQGSTLTAPPVQQKPQKLPSPVGNPLISRRAFLLGALGASVLLTGLSMVKAGDILGPLIPSPAPAQVVADWNILNQNYSNVLNSSSLYQPIHYSEFFYWPYDSSLSPYYKNIIARLPDAAGTNPLYPVIPSSPRSWRSIRPASTSGVLLTLVMQGILDQASSGSNAHATEAN